MSPGPFCCRFHGDLRSVRARCRAFRQKGQAPDVRATPAVGPIISSCTPVAAIDDPSRFTASNRVGPSVGLTPKKYQSGETDYTGRISQHW